MDNKTILLVEDNADDEALTLRALKKNNIGNQVIIARDGAEALDYLFGTGKYSGRDAYLMPQVVLLDLKLPKIDGLEVLRKMRGPGTNWARTVMSANLSTSMSSSRLCVSWDCTG